MRQGYLHADRSDRAKAASAAIAVHLLLGAALLIGLANHIDRKTSDSLTTFAVLAPLPPPPVEERHEQSAKATAAPAGKKAVPSPIVAPPSKIPVQEPVAAAPVAGTGAASSAGASTSGSGSDAGGSGVGSGGGGNGAGRVGARLLSGGLGSRDYRQIAAIGLPRGEAELLLLINPAGRIERCRALRSSGNPAVDNILCQTLLDRARFSPAREADGSPLYQDVRYFPSWSR